MSMARITWVVSAFDCFYFCKSDSLGDERFRVYGVLLRDTNGANEIDAAFSSAGRKRRRHLQHRLHLITPSPS